MQNLTVDGVEYRVRIVFDSLSRAFQIMDGPNAGTAITARDIRDILGTGYSYKMAVEPNPNYPEDYDQFYDVISAPVESHSVIMPYGQRTIEFEAKILSGEDRLGPTIAGAARWHGLSVTFTPIKPQKEG